MSLSVIDSSGWASFGTSAVSYSSSATLKATSSLTSSITYANWTGTFKVYGIWIPEESINFRETKYD